MSQRLVIRQSVTSVIGLMYIYIRIVPNEFKAEVIFEKNDALYFDSNE